MKIEYIVAEGAGGWRLRQGQRDVAAYESRDSALLAAENFAKSAATNGERGVVKVLEAGNLREHRSFLPDIF